jgi:hypothetical protein
MLKDILVISKNGGRVAQLGERIVRNDEVAGSTPVSSTKFQKNTLFSHSCAGSPLSTKIPHNVFDFAIHSGV